MTVYVDSDDIDIHAARVQNQRYKSDRDFANTKEAEVVQAFACRLRRVHFFCDLLIIDSHIKQ